ALPHVGLAFVADVGIVIGRDHAAGGGVDGLVAGEEIGVLFLLIGDAARGDVAFGVEVAARLIEGNHVGGSGAGGVPDARAGFERHLACVLFERRLPGNGLAIAFDVVEIVPLLHAGQLAGLGIEVR